MAIGERSVVLEQRVRTMAGWIGVEISRSRVRTPGKPGYGLYRVRGQERYAAQDSMTGRWTEPGATRPTEWTAYAFTLEVIDAAVRNSIEQGRPEGPMELRLVEAGSAVRTGSLGYAGGVVVPTRWTPAYRGRRDLGVPVAPASIRTEVGHRLTAIAALVDEGLVLMRHDPQSCACSGTARMTMRCVDLTMLDEQVTRSVRLKQGLMVTAAEVSPLTGMPIGSAPCGCPNRMDGLPPALHRCCRCGFEGGPVVHGECPGCRETRRSRQRAQNAAFQAEHAVRRAAGLERRHAEKLSRRKRSGDGADGPPAC